MHGTLVTRVESPTDLHNQIILSISKCANIWSHCRGSTFNADSTFQHTNRLAGRHGRPHSQSSKPEIERDPLSTQQSHQGSHAEPYVGMKFTANQKPVTCADHMYLSCVVVTTDTIPANQKLLAVVCSLPIILPVGNAKFLQPIRN